MIPEEALLITLRAAYNAGNKWKKRPLSGEDNIYLLALVPEEARRVLLESCATLDCEDPAVLCAEHYAQSCASVRAEGRREAFEEAVRIVEAERDKLGGRWSLDSAYLSQAVTAIRAIMACEGGGAAAGPDDPPTTTYLTDARHPAVSADRSGVVGSEEPRTSQSASEAGAGPASATILAFGRKLLARVLPQGVPPWVTNMVILTLWNEVAGSNVSS